MALLKTATSKIDNNNSIKNIINISGKFLIVFLTLLLIINFSDEAYAKKKKRGKRSRRVVRVYNPTQTKANTIAILQTSEELSELAKIEVQKTSTESSAYEKIEQTSAPAQQKSAGKATSTLNNNLDYSEAFYPDVSDVELLKTFLREGEDLDFEIGEYGEDATELEKEDDIKVNLSDFKSIWRLAIGSSDMERTSFGTDKEELMGVIMDWVGTPYQFGGVTSKAIDCSAWIRAIFYQVDSIMLPRTAREQILLGRKVSREKLEFGDLIFFYTYSKKFASHVGIYLGDNLFAHASSVSGVTVSNLNSTYYATRFIGGRRFNEDDFAGMKTAKITH